MKPVVVVGGGLSGLAAGVFLAKSDTPVLLLEQKAYLGGRAYSFRDRVSGETIDNGQHLLIAGNRKTLGLLATLGTGGRVWIPGRPEFAFHHPARGFRTLRLPRVPSPLNLLLGAWTSRLYDGKDVRGLVRAGLALARMRESEVAPITVHQWLARMRQPPDLVQSFWEPLAVSIMNERPDVAAALPFLRSLAVAFLEDSRSGSIVIPQTGLSELFAEPAAAYILRHGGQVRCRTEAVSLVCDEGCVRGVRTRDGALYECNAVIIALPPQGAEALLRDPLRGQTQFLHTAAFATSPIVSMHLWFERDFMPQTVLGLIGRRVQWVYNRRRISGTAGKSGGHLSTTISAAREYADMSNEELLRIAREDLASVWGSAAEGFLRGVVIREKHATVSLTPAAEQLRPGPHLPIAQVFLAGDWTATGYPATIESAVTSGERAAAIVLGLLGRADARG